MEYKLGPRGMRPRKAGGWRGEREAGCQTWEPQQQTRHETAGLFPPSQAMAQSRSRGKCDPEPGSDEGTHHACVCTSPQEAEGARCVQAGTGMPLTYPTPPSSYRTAPTIPSSCPSGHPQTMHTLLLTLKPPRTICKDFGDVVEVGGGGDGACHSACHLPSQRHGTHELKDCCDLQAVWSKSSGGGVIMHRMRLLCNCWRVLAQLRLA